MESVVHIIYEVICICASQSGTQSDMLVILRLVELLRHRRSNIYTSLSKNVTHVVDRQSVFRAVPKHIYIDNYKILNAHSNYKSAWTIMSKC